MQKITYLLVLTALLFQACMAPSDTAPVPAKNAFELTGQAQGTTFQIKYYGENAADFSTDVEKILRDIDQSMSLWVEDSDINIFNRDGTNLISIPDENHYFEDVYMDSKRVYGATKGYFDPSIDPLIEHLGFGTKEAPLDLSELEKIKELCQFNNEATSLASRGGNSNPLVINKLPSTQLNFNAIAQGYAVDVISDFLIEKGVTNHYVEIGGELKVSGLNPQELPWKIGVDRPTDGQRIVDYTVQLDNQALATSGSYRKFKLKDGKKYSHTINPKSGLPVTHNLLSVSVL